MINVAELLSDQDFAQPFTADRSSGTFAPGGYQDATQQVRLYGAVQVADQDTLEQVPDGDRVAGARVFYSSQAIYETNAKGISDVLSYNGDKYRVIRVWSQPENGYWKAYATRMSGV